MRHAVRALAAVIVCCLHLPAQEPAPAPTPDPSGEADLAAALATIAGWQEQYPELVRRAEIGTSAGQRPLFVLRVGSAADGAPELYIGGGIHGHERSEEDALFLVEQLLRHATEPAIAALLRSRVLWVQPLINPDGVANRQRKNANAVDLNRNFGARWHAGPEPDSVNYPGSAAFSEPETRAMREFLLQRPRLRACLDLHRSADLLIAASGGQGVVDGPVREALGALLAAVGWGSSDAAPASFPAMTGLFIDWAWTELGTVAAVMENRGDPQEPPERDARWLCLLHLLERCAEYPENRAAVAVRSAPKEPASPDRPSPRRPNVVLILTDDQGFGDFGFNGNELVHTPVMDRLRERSAWLSTFYVTPTCATTRASILTGRYHPVTGVVTNDHALDPEETTLAELFRDAGYATGLFGKWHLGKHHPRRPQDQGFEEVLTFRGGLLRELEPEPVEVRYSDPMLYHGERLERAQGYAEDVFFDAAGDWIERCHAAGRPFLCYLPTAAPHRPWSDPPSPEVELYREQGLDDYRAALYAMITRVDTNLGRLLARLEELGIAEDTLVVLLGDNGPEGERFNAGLRAGKADVYEGGIREPLLVCWPGRLTPGEVSGLVGAHFDLLPTLLEACGIAFDPGRFHGTSLLPGLRRESRAPAERTLFFHASASGRFDLNWAVRTAAWKLVKPDGFKSESSIAPLELYRIADDPFEQHDLAADHPDVVAELDRLHDVWLEAMRAEQDLDAPLERASIGAGPENPVLLTRVVEDGTANAWTVDALETARYRVRFRFAPMPAGGRATLDVRAQPDRPLKPRVVPLSAGDTECTFEDVRIRRGQRRIWTELASDAPQAAGVDVWQVELERLDGG